MLLPLRNCAYSDYEAVEKILSTDKLPKSKVGHTRLKRVIGENSLITLDGVPWLRMRKMFNPAFASTQLETVMISHMVEESEIFVKKLEAIADTGTVVKMNEMAAVSTAFTVLTLAPYVRYHSKVIPSRSY